MSRLHEHHFHELRISPTVFFALRPSAKGSALALSTERTTPFQQQAERPSRAVLERPRVYAKPTQQRFFVCSRPCAGPPTPALVESRVTLRSLPC